MCSRKWTLAWQPRLQRCSRRLGLHCAVKRVLLVLLLEPLHATGYVFFVNYDLESQKYRNISYSSIENFNQTRLTAPVIVFHDNLVHLPEKVRDLSKNLELSSYDLKENLWCF